ncbi:MAG: TIGR04255 family protein [Deltaproteobacteria bacterium]|nr:TIGR04255 family protein [Deltaproteobacteria bacterium]
MAEYPTYPNAPIIEAILDIHAFLPINVSLDQLRSLHARIQDRYPEKQERIAIKSSFNLDFKEKRPITTGLSKIDGFLFRSSIEGKIVQSRLDGFTFNKLKPYESWILFSAEAKEMWNYYCELVNPIKINRFSLRYINKIIIPFNADIKDYFLTGPEIGNKLPQTFGSFFMRLEVPNEKIDSVGLINIASQPAEESGFPIIFDIDVIRNIVISSNDEKLWLYFEELREFKNVIFFESLTEKAKEMFS